MSEPFWLDEAIARCPADAADYRSLNAALQALPKDAAMQAFVDLYERMLEARDRLYDVWISSELEA